MKYREPKFSYCPNVGKKKVNIDIHCARAAKSHKGRGNVKHRCLLAYLNQLRVFRIFLV